MEQTKKSTEALLTSFVRGDMTAFSQLYDLHINPLLSYGLKLTLDKELLKDCIHDVFVKLYNKRNELDLAKIENLKSYLFISLRNKLLDEVRKRVYMSDVAVEDVNATATDNIEEEYVLKEQHDNEFLRVHYLLDQLSPRQREALTLYYIEEKKYEDICEIMQMNYQSVRNLMYRGLTKLRSLAS